MIVDGRERRHVVQRKASVIEVGHQACARVKGVVAIQVCGQRELEAEDVGSMHRTCHVCDVVLLLWNDVVARAGEQGDGGTLA